MAKSCKRYYGEKRSDRLQVSQMGSAIDYNTYRWINQNGVWKLESTSEDGVKTVLPEGVIPARAPSRFEEASDYGKWKKKSEEFKDIVEEVSAR